MRELVQEFETVEDSLNIQSGLVSAVRAVAEAYVTDSFRNAAVVARQRMRRRRRTVLEPDGLVQSRIPLAAMEEDEAKDGAFRYETPSSSASSSEEDWEDDEYEDEDAEVSVEEPSEPGDRFKSWLKDAYSLEGGVADPMELDAVADDDIFRIWRRPGPPPPAQKDHCKHFDWDEMVLDLDVPEIGPIVQCDCDVEVSKDPGYFYQTPRNERTRVREASVKPGDFALASRLQTHRPPPAQLPRPDVLFTDSFVGREIAEILGRQKRGEKEFRLTRAAVRVLEGCLEHYLTELFLDANLVSLNGLVPDPAAEKADEEVELEEEDEDEDEEDEYEEEERDETPRLQPSDIRVVRYVRGVRREALY